MKRTKAQRKLDKRHEIFYHKVRRQLGKPSHRRMWVASIIATVIAGRAFSAQVEKERDRIAQEIKDYWARQDNTKKD